MKVLITGATGMIGGAVAHALHARDDEVVGLARDPERAGAAVPYVSWHRWSAGEEPPAAALEGIEGVINLAGEPIDQRWTAEAKSRIYDSRVQGTQALVKAVLAMSRRPQVLVNGSAVGYYGDRGSATIDESAAAGTSFDSRVCAAWEDAAREVEREPDGVPVRLVIVRSGLVLSTEGGLLSELLLPFKLGVGGPIAGGGNYMPWISLTDEVRLLLWALDTESASGVYNAVAPTPLTNREFSKALGRALHRPAVMPIPKLALRLRLGSELAEVATGGQRAIPKRATEHGFEFEHATIDAALSDELHR